MRHFPIFLKLAGRPALVPGSGTAADAPAWSDRGPTLIPVCEAVGHRMTLP